MKTVKPETQIRNLKKEVVELRMLLEFIGVPPIVILLPEIAINEIPKAEKKKMIFTSYEPNNLI